MDVREVIKSQYHASLEMLKRAVEKCPESLWADPEPKNKFWHIAFHVLFYTYFYLQDSEDSFTPWAKHRPTYQFLSAEDPPHIKPEIGEPYRKDEILEYIELCDKQVDEKVASVNFEAASGFPWLPFSKLELQIDSIRHIQHHAGQLIDRLRTKHNIEIEWVGMKPGSPA